jgi:hypothetical protein
MIGVLAISYSLGFVKSSHAIVFMVLPSLSPSLYFLSSLLRCDYDNINIIYILMLALYVMYHTKTNFKSESKPNLN